MIVNAIEKNGKNKKEQDIERYSKGQFLECITYRQKKQKPHIDFLRLLCYNKYVGIIL